MKELPVDPSKLERLTSDGREDAFLGGARSPSPKQRAWLHQLLGRLPETERVMMHLRLQQWSQRDIAAQLGVTQPAVCWRLKAAHRRLCLLGKLPRPPVSVTEARAALVPTRGPNGRWHRPQPEDAELLVRCQRMGLVQVETELGLAMPSSPGLFAARRLRAMRVMCAPEAARVRTLLDLLVLEFPRGRAFRSPPGDLGRPGDGGLPRAHTESRQQELIARKEG
ncbi:MAG TPA: sigma factor-like helix-turn-helix DNA-binding protein [Polyangiaceae bacterium]|nr:sigma factor-like helix-turn-helix DNA-binding protein [Polyangiaceae bacterium]